MELDINKELKELQTLASSIWFRIDRILTDTKRGKVDENNKNKTKIENLGLSVYSTRCLLRRGIKYAEHLPKTKKDLMRIRGIGEKTAISVLEKINHYIFENFQKIL